MEELPKAFVSSLRVLFEILDEDSDGFVQLQEIEKRWQGGDGEVGAELPAGVVDSLRGIAPQDGMLSFDRFCTGLKITLEKNRSMSRARQVQVRGARNSKDDKQLTTATVRPNNVVHPMRTKSAPQLQEVAARQNTKPSTRQLRGSRSSTSVPDEKRSIDPPDYASYMMLSGKDKTRRSRSTNKSDDYANPHSRSRSTDASDAFAADRKRIEVEATIKSWQLEKKQRSVSDSNFPPKKADLIYDRREDLKTYAHPPQRKSTSPGEKAKQPEPHYQKAPRTRAGDSAQKANGRRKREEPRRHTLSNGIDYNMIKRMKQLEQERDTFLQGLEALELTKDWYKQQLADIRSRQDRLNKAQMDFAEDLDFQDMIAYRTTRITELNRQLRALVATPEKGFPNHMNLAINRFGKPAPPSNSSTGAPLLDKIKHQNKLLTEEVSSKSDRIAKLEQEKAALIRQLFEARGRNRDLPDNTTFL